MKCNHCGKEVKRVSKPKSLFGIMLGRIHSCFIDNNHVLPEYRRSERWSEWHGKLKYSNNSLRDVVEKFQSLELNEDNRKIACILKLIDGKYVPGNIYDFPDGTLAWFVDQYMPRSFSNYEGSEIKKLNKYWRFRVWRKVGRLENAIVTCDPKAGMYFLRYLFIPKDDKNKNPNLPFPPIYDKYLKLDPNAHIDSSKEWDSIINTTWIKPIIEFIREFKVDQNDRDWKRLMRQSSGEY